MFPAQSKQPQSGPPKPTVAETILRTWRRHDIDVLFTVPGGPLMPFLRACHSAQYPQVVICRHETAACIAAASYYRESGLAAVALTSGPGAANAINGILHAMREQLAMFVLTARPVASKAGRGAVQDFDSASALRAFTKRSEQITHPRQASYLPANLAELAVAPCAGPVNLTVSADLWQERVT